MGGQVGHNCHVVIMPPIVLGILPSPPMTAATQQQLGRQTITNSSNNNLVKTLMLHDMDNDEMMMTETKTTSPSYQTTGFL
jgi:hypothetical protein